VDLDFVEARRLYELASGQGLGTATYKLAYMAHAGTDSASDFDLAMRLYRQATDQGEPSGWDGIGQLYQFGQGVDQDYAKAAEAYQHGADAGEQMSEAALGYLYEQGLGVTKDLDQAFALMTASADQGYGPAQANLALYYLFGEGTPADPDRAYPLIWQAIGKGAPGADGILGYMYAEGLGTDRDLDSALLHFQTGADNGDEYAAGRIEPTKTELACEDAAGSTHEPGGSFHGVEFEAIDPETAIAACKAALEANPGSVGDGVWLARAYLKAGEASEALPLLEAGTKAGNVLALSLYAELLIAGDALAADPARAIALYDQAAAKTFAPALMALGRIYASGEIVPPDVDKAADYFERAYEAGLDAAKAELTALREGTDISASSELAAGFGEEGPAY
jgi:TPR repeat protein